MESLRPDDPPYAGPYRLTRRLGAGGMGEVFLGSSRGGRLVVVKLVHVELASDPDFRRRFALEVSAARTVGGFYTAQVVDADTTAARPWLATAYIPGPTLREAIDQHGPLPVETLRILGAGLAEGLSAIHACGIVHRDLTPRNVILASDGPRVIDFGIARALGEARQTDGHAMGTPGFMSPEHVLGNEVGPASDIFSLGAVLAYAASGHGPFGMGPWELVAYRACREDPDLSSVPPEIAELVRSCLAKNPGDRPGISLILDRLALEEPPGNEWLPAPITLTIPPVTDPDEVGPPPDPDPPEASPTRRRVLIAGLGIAAAGTIAVGTDLSLAGGGANSQKQVTSSSQSTRFGSPVTLSATTDGKSVLTVAFAPHGTLLASAGHLGTISLWNAATGKRERTLTHQPVNPFSKSLSAVTAHNAQFTSTLFVTFSPDGEKVAAGNGDGTISIWEIATGHESVLPYLNPVESTRSYHPVAIHPSGKTLASSYNSPSFAVQDPGTGTSIATLSTGGTDWGQGLAFTPSGDLLITATGNDNRGADDGDGRIQFWDTGSYSDPFTLARTNVAANGLTASPDGKTFAALGQFGLLTLWDIPARTRRSTLARDSSGATCVAFGPGNLLAGGFDDGTVALWDTASGKRTTTLSGDGDGALNCVAIGPDGKTIAGGGARLTLWKVK